LELAGRGFEPMRPSWMGRRKISPAAQLPERRLLFPVAGAAAPARGAETADVPSDEVGERASVGSSEDEEPEFARRPAEEASERVSAV
jgi:hypothetical protein